MPSQFWLTIKSRRQRRICLAAFLFLIFLTACNPDSGLPNYEIEYPSGSVITSITELTEPFPIEQSDLELYTKHIKGRAYQMYIQDQDGAILYTSEDTLSHNRGQLVDGALWICEENWSCVHQQQFVDNTLEAGRIYELDIKSGEIQDEYKLGKNEFLITISDNKCYFYHRGEESKKKLFGLTKTKTKNAEIYYREISDWKEKQIVYTFDYAGVPHEAKNVGNFTLYFAVQENEILLNLHSYEKLSNGEWGNIPVWSVDIPFH